MSIMRTNHFRVLLGGLILLLAAVVAPARAADSEPWAMADKLRAALFAAQTATLGDDAAAASYFGVSDAEALARDTHKFESRYSDNCLLYTSRCV